MQNIFTQLTILTKLTKKCLQQIKKTLACLVLAMLIFFLFPTGHTLTNSLASLHQQGELRAIINATTSTRLSPQSLLAVELLQHFAQQEQLKLTVSFESKGDQSNPDPRQHSLKKTADVLVYVGPQALPLQSYRWIPISRPSSGYDIEIPLLWATPATQDLTLAHHMTEYLNEAIESGLVDTLKSRFFLSPNQRHPMDRYYFTQYAHNRLPKFQTIFEKVGRELNLDWKLLAAIAYQESQWNPNAISPSGVRGLMMLTRITAKEMGVTDRTDAKQSIRGGSQYFLKLKRRLPTYIQEPDRTWMALAAYNMGYSNIHQALMHSQQIGTPTSDWFQLKQQLTPPKHPEQYAYLTGSDQAKAYVNNIRYYYDLLSHPNFRVAESSDDTDTQTDSLISQRP